MTYTDSHSFLTGWGRRGKRLMGYPNPAKSFFVLVSARELVKFQLTKMKNKAAAWSNSLRLVRRSSNWQVSAATVRTHCNDCDYFTILAIVHRKFVNIVKKTRLPSHTLTIVAIFYQNCDRCEIPSLGIQVATITCHCRSCPPKYPNKVGESNSAFDQSNILIWKL